MYLKSGGRFLKGRAGSTRSPFFWGRCMAMQRCCFPERWCLNEAELVQNCVNTHCILRIASTS